MTAVLLPWKFLLKVTPYHDCIGVYSTNAELAREFLTGARLQIFQKYRANYIRLSGNKLAVCFHSNYVKKQKSGSFHSAGEEGAFQPDFNNDVDYSEAYQNVRNEINDILNFPKEFYIE